MADTSRTLSVKWVGDASSLTKSADTAQRKVGGFGKAVGKVGTIAAGAFTGQALLQGAQQVVGFLSDATQAAIEDEKGQRTLAKTLTNVAGATSKQVEATEAWIDKTQRASGIADDELRPALANIARATGDVGKAQDLTKLAMDASVGTGKDLGSVSAAIGKAYAGNYGALKKLVPTIDLARAKTEGFGYVQGELNKTFGGQAAAAANTTAGKMQRLKIQWSEMQEEIGARLLPMLIKLMNFLMNDLPRAIDVVVKWVQTNWPKIRQYIQPILDYVVSTFNNIKLVVQGLIQVFQGLIDFIAGVFTGDWSRAWDGIVQIFSGVALILFGIWKQLLNWLSTAWKYAWMAIVAALKAVWALIVSLIRGYITLWITIVTGAVSLISRLLSSAWNGLVSGLGTAWNFIVTFFKSLPGRALGLLGDALSFGLRLGNAIKDGIVHAVQGVGELLGDIVRGALRFVIGAWNGIDLGIHIHIPDWVPGLGGKGFDIDDVFPDIRGFATGGITTSEGLAYLHANEAVVPLSRAGAMSTNHYTINVNVPLGANPADVGKAVVDSIRAYERRNGATWRAS